MQVAVVIVVRIFSIFAVGRGGREEVSEEVARGGGSVLVENRGRGSIRGGRRGAMAPGGDVCGEGGGVKFISQLKFPLSQDFRLCHEPPGCGAGHKWDFGGKREVQRSLDETTRLAETCMPKLRNTAEMQSRRDVPKSAILEATRVWKKYAPTGSLAVPKSHLAAILLLGSFYILALKK